MQRKGVLKGRILKISKLNAPWKTRILFSIRAWGGGGGGQGEHVVREVPSWVMAL